MYDVFPIPDACAIWRVPGLSLIVYGMPGQLPSTPHVCSTWLPCAGQLLDAGRGLALLVGKEGRGGTQVAQSQRATLASRHSTYGLPAGRISGPLPVHKLEGLSSSRPARRRARARATPPEDGAVGAGAGAGGRI
jgi:hypothetical protein